MVYSRVPSSWIRSSLLGMVMLCATDFFPLWKNVSGVQILLAIRLFKRRIFIGPSNFSRSSFQLCLKKTSMVYSCIKMKRKQILDCMRFCCSDSVLFVTSEHTIRSYTDWLAVNLLLCTVTIQTIRQPYKSLGLCSSSSKASECNSNSSIFLPSNDL